MKRRVVNQQLLAVGALAFALPVRADEDAAGKSFLERFGVHWRSTKDYTLAVYDAMPPEGFDFKPAPEQRSFGEQFLHLAGSNRAYLRAFFGDESLPLPEAPNRESVREFMVKSFDYCAGVIAKLAPKELAREDLRFGRGPRAQQHTGAEILLRAYMHTAHHRGQAVVYLRLKGITPPAWVFPAIGAA